MPMIRHVSNREWNVCGHRHALLVHAPAMQSGVVLVPGYRGMKAQKDEIVSRLVPVYHIS